MDNLEGSNQNNRINLQGQKLIISVEDLYDLTFAKILNDLQNTSKQKLATLNLFDLALVNEQPLKSAGGVYLFFGSDNTCLYVSKATSRSFISRVSSLTSTNVNSLLSKILIIWLKPLIALGFSI